MSHILSVPFIKPENISVYAQYTIEVLNREILQKKMKARGIPTAVHYPSSLHQQPIFAPYRISEDHYPVSERASSHVLSLPMHPYLKQSEQEFIVNALLESN